MIATIIPSMTAIGIHSQKSLCICLNWYATWLIHHQKDTHHTIDHYQTPLGNEIAVDHARSLCRLSTFFQLR